MLFNSYIFILLFLPICLGGFYALYRQKKELWIYWVNLCSVAFYAYWSLTHLLVFIASIVFNFVIAKQIAGRNKLALAFGVSANLALLGYFKYTNFLIEIVNDTTGLGVSWLEVVLPIGISFFTFQQIAYLVDVYQDKVKPIAFHRYFFFVSFFPQLIAGPIVHHSEIFGQFAKYKNHARNLAIGLSIFTIGLFKKVFIADEIAKTANTVFDYAQNGGNPSFIEAWYGATAYALQIYFDFSAYSDMAIGLAFCFGLRLPQNFASPYKSISIIEFWRRWHITLSRFLRDYLYIPLGGNRLGDSRQKINIMITMLLGGLWHGASWTFIIWGGLHGIFLLVNHLYRNWSKAKGHIQMPKLMAWIITMFVVVFAWVPFRAESFEAMQAMWQGMVMMNGIALPDQFAFVGLPTAQLLHGVNFNIGLMIFVLIAICVFMPNVSDMFRRYNVTIASKGYEATILHPAKIRWRATLLWGALITIIFWLCLLKLNDPSEFLYFQF